jgi:hypothetical protein
MSATDQPQTPPSADPQPPAPEAAAVEAPAVEEEEQADEAAPAAPSLEAQLVEISGEADAPAALARFRSLVTAAREAEAAERRSLVADLISLGAETPATAWANGAPTSRLAAEPLPELRARVAALRSRPVASASVSAPPAGQTSGEEQLTDFERADAAKIQDPVARARFVAGRLARKNKHHG